MKRFVPNGVLLLLSLAACAGQVRACAWDRDTLESEAKGIPDTVRIVTGRFERNPDLYYEMRLARVSREVRATPANLELYDDAGVASDRLHKGDEAIAWMERKRDQMAKLQSSTPPHVFHEHRYRLLANEGTFIAHRWLRNGADRTKIAEMKRARDLIAAAIKLNPGAHFGREKYQLQVMEWIIAPRKTKKDFFPSFINQELENPEAHQAVEGLSGLIALGDAWNSVDVFHALAVAVQNDNRQSQVAYLTFLRALELARSGKSSLAMPKATGEVLAKRIMDAQGYVNTTDYADTNEIETSFKELRAEADEWHAQRTAYLVERLKAGRHPDTDNTFWNEWQEPPAPALYASSALEAQKRYWTIGAMLVGVLLLSVLMLRFKRRQKAGQ